MTTLRVVALLGALGVVSACGSAVEPVAEPLSPGTARFETTTRTEWNGRVDVFRESGSVDYRRGRRMSESDWNDDETSRSIVIGDVYYYTDPELPPGKRWVRFTHTPTDWQDALDDECEDLALGEDEAEPAEERKADQESCVSQPMIAIGLPVDEEDPARIMKWLRENGSDVRTVGRDIVRGTNTTQYALRVDMREVTFRELREEGLTTEQIERLAGWISRESDPVEVWVDDLGLVRRVRWTSREGHDELGSSTSVMTTEYFDFGIPVAIDLPSPDEVIEAAEWDKLLEQRAQEEGEEWVEPPDDAADDDP